MSITICKKTSLVFLALVLVSIPLMAQGGKDNGQGGKHTGLASNPPAMMQVSGTVVSVDFAYGEGYPNFELQVAGGSKIAIYVGPLRYIDDNDFDLSVNDRIDGTIFPDPLSNNAYVAAVLTNVTTGKTLVFRDAIGFPLWIRPSTPGHMGFGPNNDGSARLQRGLGMNALQAGQPSIDLKTVAVYEGTVVKVNSAPGEKHPTVEVVVSGVSATFCLGPYRYLEDIGFTAMPGDKVVIKAADCAVDPDEYVVFEFTIKGGKTFYFRAEDGTPVWYFGKRK